MVNFTYKLGTTVLPLLLRHNNHYFSPNTQQLIKRMQQQFHRASFEQQIRSHNNIKLSFKLMVLEPIDTWNLYIGCETIFVDILAYILSNLSIVICGCY